MPEYPWVISRKNNPFPWHYDKITVEDTYDKFGRWYHSEHDGKSVILLGLRADESLNRYRAYANKTKETIGGHNWTTKVRGEEGLFIGYPIYDWDSRDVWIANGREGFDYNRIYDLYHKAGLSLHQMRVASPYIEASRHSLNLYRIIDPDIWERLCGRVHGANFAAIYGGTKALGVKQIRCPEEYTWESYLRFLLETLPEEVAANYRKKFETSVEF